MERVSTGSISRAALGLLLAVFAVNLYRAATLAITTDEAVTFVRWVRPRIRDVLPQPYNPNNHILNTLLVKRSVGLLRLSEFSFRLPAVLAGGFYLWAVYRLARRLLGTGPLSLAAVALCALNPQVVDSLSAARGYGMGLALWIWALDWMIEYLQSDEEHASRNLNLAGMCLGLSAAANLAFLFQSAALIVIFVVVAMLRGRSSWIVLTERLVITGFVTGFVLLAIPLSHAQSGNLTDGEATLSLMAAPPASLAALALVRRVNRRAVSTVAVAMAALITGFYLSQFRIGYYRRWPQDAGARSVVQALRHDAGGRHIRIGASPEVEPILSFYAARFRLANWEPMRHGPVTGDFDYYVLDSRDADMVAQRRLQVVYRDSGLTLARRSPD